MERKKGLTRVRTLDFERVDPRQKRLKVYKNDYARRRSVVVVMVIRVWQLSKWLEAYSAETVQPFSCNMAVFRGSQHNLDV